MVEIEFFPKQPSSWSPQHGAPKPMCREANQQRERRAKECARKSGGSRLRRQQRETLCLRRPRLTAARKSSLTAGPWWNCNFGETKDRQQQGGGKERPIEILPKMFPRKRSDHVYFCAIVV